MGDPRRPAGGAAALPHPRDGGDGGRGVVARRAPSTRAGPRPPRVTSRSAMALAETLARARRREPAEAAGAERRARRSTNAVTAAVAGPYRGCPTAASQPRVRRSARDGSAGSPSISSRMSPRTISASRPTTASRVAGRRRRAAVAGGDDVALGAVQGLGHLGRDEPAEGREEGDRGRLSERQPIELVAPSRPTRSTTAATRSSTVAGAGERRRAGPWRPRPRPRSARARDRRDRRPLPREALPVVAGPQLRVAQPIVRDVDPLRGVQGVRPGHVRVMGPEEARHATSIASTLASRGTPSRAYRSSDGSGGRGAVMAWWHASGRRHGRSLCSRPAGRFGRGLAPGGRAGVGSRELHQEGAGGRRGGATIEEADADRAGPVRRPRRSTRAWPARRRARARRSAWRKRGVNTVIERIDPGTLAELIVKATALQEMTNGALRAKGSPYRISEISIAATIPPGVNFAISRIDDVVEALEEVRDRSSRRGGGRATARSSSRSTARTWTRRRPRRSRGGGSPPATSPRAR